MAPAVARRRIPAPIVAAAARARIVIAGGPRAGKTTLSHELYDAPHHADSESYRGWSEASLEVSTWFDAPGPWVVEGASTARALRKWLRRNPTGRPCDVAILLGVPYETLTVFQAAMAKGCVTVWRGIEAELAARGVRVQRGWPRIVGAAEVEVTP